MGKPEYPGKNKQTFVGRSDINLDEGFTAIKAKENNNNNNKRERAHTYSHTIVRGEVLLNVLGCQLTY